MNETTSLAGDLDLVRRTALVLNTRGICGAEQVVISAKGGTVILCGAVQSPRAKWQCLECCRHVAGVMRIVDLLLVPEGDSPPPVPEVAHDGVSTIEAPVARRVRSSRRRAKGPVKE